MLNNQQIFDTVAAHLLTQGEKALSGDDFNCAYRGNHDFTCAVGCLITDESYDPLMEGKRASMLFVVFPDVMKASKLSVRSKALLMQLQAIHDNTDPDSWCNRLKTAARYFGLNQRALNSTNEESANAQ